MRRHELPVIVIGSGGHARVLIEALQACGRRVLSITDSADERFGRAVRGIMIEGPDKIIFEYNPNHIELVNAIGSVSTPELRKSVYNRFVTRGYRFAKVAHPSAVISSDAELAQGSQVLAGAVIQAGAVVGANVIVNTHASIDHDCALGMHTHIAPGVTLSGNVEVGQTCHIGTGASVIQGIKIGHTSFVAAGAVVVANIPPYGDYRGVPARPSDLLQKP